MEDDDFLLSFGEIAISKAPIFRRSISVHYGGCFNGTWEFIPLDHWLLDIFHKDDVFQEVISSFRMGNEYVYDKLPIASLGCTINFYEESGITPFGFTGLMDFDIRQDNNPCCYLREIVTELAKLPQIAYLGLDTNGKDYFGIIPISNPNRYAEHFRALKNTLRKYDIHISGSENVCHTRKISFDHDPYTNENAKVFDIL